MLKRQWLLVAILVATGMLTTGCDRLWQNTSGTTTDLKTRSADLVCGEPLVVPIIAGQHYNAGDVTVWNCTNYLYVAFQNTGDWTTSEVHIAVARTCAELPRNGAGHLVPGLFPYSEEYDPAVTCDTFMIPLGDFEPDDTICIAFHCVVTSPTFGGQTGWGYEWKGCFDYTIQRCTKNIELPDYIVYFMGWSPNGTASAWRFQFSGVGAGYAVQDGVDFLGWAAEQTGVFNQGQSYPTILWSTLTYPLPIRLRLGRAGDTAWPYGWDNVNWILNNKQGTIDDVQAAIWYMLGTGAYPADPDAQAMIAGALANGDGWLPSAGQFIAVVMEVDCGVQLMFAEVDP